MNKLIIANWKMEFSHNDAMEWLVSHAQELEDALSRSQNKLVICPSYTELSFVSTFPTVHISWGAQDCGPQEIGAYTGDVSVLSLRQLRCTYTLLGHSERRQYHGETDETVAQKFELLMRHGISPIVCVGETKEERDEGVTSRVLEKQLSLIVASMRRNNYMNICIAYEPIWSIGSQQVPRAHEISEVFRDIRRFLGRSNINPAAILLYGGNVNERTIEDLGLSSADGFLLGRASLDHEVLKKIILSC